MSNTRSSSVRLSIFVTRRWPDAAEAALGEHFDVTLNDGDKPLLRDALIDGFASHDIAAPTVSDKIDAEIVAAGAAGKCRLIANYGVGVNHIDLAAAAAHYCYKLHLQCTSSARKQGRNPMTFDPLQA